jgi:hippurate hydrolase
MMAASDRFYITVRGQGGHASRPHACLDPIVVGAQHRHGAADDRGAPRGPAGERGDQRDAVPLRHAENVIPDEAMLLGTVRTLAPACRTWSRRDAPRGGDDGGRA